MSPPKRVFLSADWRDLVMLNYEVEPALLNRYVLPGTTLDSFQGRTYVSLVGFRFSRTKLLGCFPVPFHTDFDEVNLRFYVRRKEGSDDRRGVVFIAEVVPRRAIAATARLLYGENYTCLPMKHRIEKENSNMTAEYQWQVGGKWVASGASCPPRPSTGQPILEMGVWNSSLPNTTGVIRHNEPVAASNIKSRISRGRYGRLPKLDSKVIPAFFTGANSQPFFNDVLIARSWQMARLS